MNLLCKLFLGSGLCCVLAMPAKAQDADDHAARHHPPQDVPLHEKFYSTWHMPDRPYVSCCNDADCYPTEIKYVDGTIYAKRREDGKYIPIPPEKVERNRDNPDGRNHLCAPPPSVYQPSDTVFCFALGGAT
jgi:hypothetical protein